MKKAFILFCLVTTVIWVHAQEEEDTTQRCCKNNTFSKGEEGTPASFPGGIAVYKRWLDKGLDSKKNQELMEINKLKVQYTFRFTIDTSGRVSELQFCSRGNDLAEAIIKDVFSKSPLWQPAISKSRGKVSQSLCQTIFFDFQSD